MWSKNYSSNSVAPNMLKESLPPNHSTTEKFCNEASNPKKENKSYWQQ